MQYLYGEIQDGLKQSDSKRVRVASSKYDFLVVDDFQVF